jgi:hypothetical protein
MALRKRLLPPPRRLAGALLRAVALGTLGAALGGCPNVATPLAQPPAYEPAGQSKCAVTKSSNEPLIIEWPAAQRAKLEALAKRGAVLVRYRGCEMEVLGQCRLGSTYGYTSTTPNRERITIRNADELYARLPLGAVRLAAELEKGGELEVSMLIVGTYETDRRPVARTELEGDCARATHVVTALTVGAFEFTSAARAKVGASAEATVGGAGARSEAGRTMLNQGGDAAACVKATGEDTAPPYGCGALLRVEVTAIQSPPATAQASTSTGAPVAPTPTVEPAASTTETAPSPAANGPSPTPGPAPVPSATARMPAPSATAAAPAGAPPGSAVAPPSPEPGTTAEQLAPATVQAEPVPEVPSSWEPWVYAGAGVVAAALIVVAIVAAVGKKDEAPSYVPSAGGLGEGTVSYGRALVSW